ncbi:sugar phosphate nucleotidyltransferase [Lacipirellula parvula]|uniref:N-acetylglucosamine-1-phosphate uridyltransferase n=1 Tax=Lacipirellula parvula TaxID=2650471 RepID=A0A5K7XBS8_9BACT|nr:NTP transferase domain-containing protein [Lacipirellula parvula]BBO31786.1 N-acetylglucosamine-1-phosphate uridyltransferase [Lacipirellula parvula]
MPPAPAMAIVLAAGKGTRMKSELPKVLVPVAGRPMVRYVIDALRAAGVERVVVVVGYRADLVRTELAGLPGIEFADQTEQLGTGHAVMMCREQLASHDGPVVIVAGDSPMLQADSVATLLAEARARRTACLLGTVRRDDPTGYGRIVRSAAGDFTGIVEEKDATPEQRAITEINVSTYVFDAKELLAALDQLRADNSQREYYITDCPAILLAAGKQVAALNVLKPREALSINSPEELAQVEKVMSGV